jgi:glyoxylase-like metal-dependent hydrolase (beta-lactamase superfamily II)
MTGVSRKIKKSILPALLLMLLFFTGGCSFSREDAADPEIYSFPGVNGAANSYILASGGKAAVIDAAAPEEIIAALEDKGLQPEYLILTHGHFDHISGVDEIKGRYPGIKVLVHPGDLDKLTDAEKNLSIMFGTKVELKSEALPLEEGVRLKLGRASFEVIATPGHSAGSISLRVEDTLFTGDTLFKGSVGRTDFPGSSPGDLAVSLQKLKALPDESRVLPGHGEPTVLGEEKKNNQFLQ